MILNVSDTELTEPAGQIIISETLFHTNTTYQWDAKRKREIEVEEPDYSRIVADDFSVINRGNCRVCKQKIKPYRNKYYERHYSCGNLFSFELSMQNDYCEACAIQKAKKYILADDTMPPKKEVREFSKDGLILSRTIYQDGSEIEELTPQEAHRLNPF